MQAVAQQTSFNSTRSETAPSKTALFRERLLGRDELPAERVSEFASLSSAALSAAAVNTQAVRQRIRVDVRYGLARGQSLRAVLGGLDLALISCDHNWRDIFAGMTRLGPEGEPLRRMAVEAYLRYLDSRYQRLTALAARDTACHPNQ